MMRKIKYKSPSVGLEKMAAPTQPSFIRSSVGMDQFAGEYYYIITSRIIPYNKQARVNFDEESLAQLAETIKEHGIRQPLTIIKSEEEEGKFEVVSGERRLRAARLIGLEKVPCIILTDRSKAEEVALVENIQRQDLHPVELARALKKLVDKSGRGGQADVQKRLGLSKSTVSELVKIVGLPDVVQDALLKDNIRTRTQIRAVYSLGSKEAMLAYLAGTKRSMKRIVRPLIEIRLVNGTLDVKKDLIATLSAEEKTALKQQLSDILSAL
ncbi:MAG: ParB/RepB/Spo0J family partition protein [Holosporales bacterium]